MVTGVGFNMHRSVFEMQTVRLALGSTCKGGGFEMQKERLNPKF